MTASPEKPGRSPSDSAASQPALVRVGVARGVATLTLDSPPNRNALSAALMAELRAALAACATDESVRVIVLTHTGPVFCSGADLKETAAATAATGSAGDLPVSLLGDVLADMAECPKPVVARVGGPARAGGIGLIAAADIAVCTLDATFGFSEVRLGVIPAVISASVLPRLTSRAAAELYLTGSTFDGRRAAEIGLVSVAVPAEGLDDAVQSYCSALVRGAPGAQAGVKELLRRPAPDAATLRDEMAGLTTLSQQFFGSAEGREGVAAFWEKRDPTWVPAG